MKLDDARRAVASLGAFPDDVAIEAIGDGWSSFTFRVDQTWVARFPRDPGVAARHDRERRLLPALAETVAVAVPVPALHGEWAGLPFSLHRMLPGEPVTQATFDAATIGAAIRELHRFPVDRARELLGDRGDLEEWRAVYAGLRADVDARLRPSMGPVLRAEVDEAFELFVANRRWPDPVLVHHDLGLEHVLVDGDRVGFIDFEYAKVGDPAADFVGIWCGLGLEAARATIDAYGLADPGLTGRLRFYRAAGSLWAALHGLDTGDEGLVAAALEEAELRLANRRRAMAVALRDGQILMVEFQGRFWTLPGGGVEPGETPAQAAVRELREEAGLSGRVVRPLCRTSYGMGTSFWFVVECDGEPDCSADADTTAARWVALDEVRDDFQVEIVCELLGL